MNGRLPPWWPVLAAAALAGGPGLCLGLWPTALAAALGAALGAWAIAGDGGERSRMGTVVLALSPDLLAARRRVIHQELTRLEDAQDLQRGVFEVSAELVGCVDEEDASRRFAVALRRYWSFEASELLVWERGCWRRLGGDAATGQAPQLDEPVQLPGPAGGDLVLDLSPGVDGRAALVLRGARPQPSMVGRDAEDQRAIAEVLRGQLALSLRRVALYTSLQQLGRSDALTGAHRRWYGESRLGELVETGEVVAVLMVDVDHFKRINDGHGHATGDRVLAGLGQTLARQLRANDLLVRWGGEEFVVVLPDTQLPGARLVAERIRSAVADADLEVPITVSIGVACARQDDRAGDLVARADAACYQAKESGRDRVVCGEGEADQALIRTVPRRLRQSGTERAIRRGPAQ